jgi:hypothetical protein
MVKCTCGREWPCSHIPTSWHAPIGVHVDDAQSNPSKAEDNRG